MANIEPKRFQSVTFRAHTYTNVPQQTEVPTYVRPSLKPTARGECITADLTKDPADFQPDGWYIEWHEGGSNYGRAYVANEDVLSVGPSIDQIVSETMVSYDMIVQHNRAQRAVAECEDGLYGAWGEVLQTAAELGHKINWQHEERTLYERALHDALFAAWKTYQAGLRTALGIL